MKIAVSSTGTSIDSTVDQRFGRAPYFIVYDLENGSYNSVENSQNLNAAQGAGIQSAQNVANSGADVILSGNVGPNAFKTLSAADIEVYLVDNMSVNDAINAYKNGELKKALNNNVEGHWV